MRKLALLFLAAAMLLNAGDTTVITVHVTNKAGKPIGNASVIVRFVEGALIKLNKSHKEWELRTSEEGIAKVPSMPQGKVQVQVIAKNYQTYGETFDIKEDEKTVEIVLNPPQKQYSVHEAH